MWDQRDLLQTNENVEHSIREILKVLLSSSLIQCVWRGLNVFVVEDSNGGLGIKQRSVTNVLDDDKTEEETKKNG